VLHYSWSSREFVAARVLHKLVVATMLHGRFCDVKVFFNLNYFFCIFKIVLVLKINFKNIKIL